MHPFLPHLPYADPSTGPQSGFDHGTLSQRTYYTSAGWNMFPWTAGAGSVISTLLVSTPLFDMRADLGERFPNVALPSGTMPGSIAILRSGAFGLGAHAFLQVFTPGTTIPALGVNLRVVYQELGHVASPSQVRPIGGGTDVSSEFWAGEDTVILTASPGAPLRFWQGTWRFDYLGGGLGPPDLLFWIAAY